MDTDNKDSSPEREQSKSTLVNQEGTKSPAVVQNRKENKSNLTVKTKLNADGAMEQLANAISGKDSSGNGQTSASALKKSVSPSKLSSKKSHGKNIISNFI